MVEDIGDDTCFRHAGTMAVCSLGRVWPGGGTAVEIEAGRPAGALAVEAKEMRSDVAKAQKYHQPRRNNLRGKVSKLGQILVLVESPAGRRR